VSAEPTLATSAYFVSFRVYYAIFNIPEPIAPAQKQRQQASPPFHRMPLENPAI
jgi:hypothetical protein